MLSRSTNFTGILLKIGHFYVVALAPSNLLKTKANGRTENFVVALVSSASNS